VIGASVTALLRMTVSPDDGVLLLTSDMGPGNLWMIDRRRTGDRNDITDWRLPDRNRVQHGHHGQPRHRDTRGTVTAGRRACVPSVPNQRRPHGLRSHRLLYHRCGHLPLYR
jgi:hypothetical protein